MEIAKYKIDLEWKEFSVNAAAVHAWMQANAGEEYAGAQGSKTLEIWFKNEPSDEIKEDVQAYWEAIEEDSDEATSYKSREEIAAEEATVKAAAKASAKSKLAALGLTDEEIEALKA